MSTVIYKLFLRLLFIMFTISYQFQYIYVYSVTVSVYRNIWGLKWLTIVMSVLCYSQAWLGGSESHPGQRRREIQHPQQCHRSDRRFPNDRDSDAKGCVQIIIFLFQPNLACSACPKRSPGRVKNITSPLTP